ncbi:MAG: zinc ribbon domain-containing protein [Anaerolineae bacterium]
MRAIHRLALLNETDLALDAAKARLAEIAVALREPATLAAARAALAETERELERCWREQRELEQAQAAIRAEVARTEQRLYSGQIRNPRELENAERDLQQHRHQQAAIEDRLLEAMVATEAAVKRHAACQAELSRLSAAWEQTQAALRQEQAQLKARLPALQARQATARQAAPPELLPLYDSLRARKGGRAVAEVDGDTCSACSVAVPPSKLAAALEGEELVYCGNCGRLLWAE